MSLAATERLDDALDATTSLLSPFDSSQWLRLAVIAFFVGGLSSASGGAQVSNGGDAVGGVGAFPGLFGPGFDIAGILLVAAVLVGLALGLLFLYVGSVMEFVLVAALESRTVSVRDRFSARRWQGTRLFGFRLALFAAVALLVGIAAGFGFLLQGPGIRFLPVLFAAPVLLVAVPVALLVNGLTTVFIVPLMYDERCGVLDGWRTLWPDLRANPWETAAYVLISLVLSVVGATAVATVVGIIAAVLVFPVGVFGLVLVAVTGGFSALTLVVLAPLFLAVGLAVAAVAAVVRVPVLVYLRYYALFVLADLSAVDLLESTREATDAAVPRGLGDTPEGT